MTRGVIAGKFLPPHSGHKYLIDQGRSQCDQLTVLICDRPEFGIPAQLRKKWLEAIHPDVQFIVIQDILDDNDSPAWATFTIQTLGFRPDVVFSSENYGTSYAHYLKCRHVNVDQARVHQPISGTAVREDPWSNWQYLDPIVRAYFTKRICIVGAESSGTTTLTKSLAEYYGTNWVAEYGRAYTELHQSELNHNGWKTSDFTHIAQEQNRLEDEAAAGANKLLFCDTDSFATSIWHERYMNRRSPEVEALAVNRQYTLYLLTHPEIPFEQDGMRDGEALRPWMHERFEEKLRFWSKPYVVMRGSQDERVKRAVSIIDQLNDGSAVQIKGLVRNKWQPRGGF